MQTVQTNLLARDDTFFGVCEALGEDLGINAQLLRVAFAVGTFFDPVIAIASYAGLGLLIALTRWAVPNPKPAAAPDAEDAREATAREIVGTLGLEEEEVRLAA